MQVEREVRRAERQCVGHRTLQELGNTTRAISTKLTVSTTCREHGSMDTAASPPAAEPVPTAVTAASGCGNTSNATCGSDATACSASCNLLTAGHSSSRMTAGGGGADGVGRGEER